MIHIIRNITEQRVLSWFMWSGISQNSVSCHDSYHQEYHRTACPVMIHVIRDIKEQHVLPWFLWSGIPKNRTSCHNSCDQGYHTHWYLCILLRGSFCFPVLGLYLLQSNLALSYFSVCNHFFFAFLSFVWKKIRSEEGNKWKSTNTNLWFTLVRVFLRVFFLNIKYISSRISPNVIKCIW